MTRSSRTLLLVALALTFSLLATACSDDASSPEGASGSASRPSSPGTGTTSAPSSGSGSDLSERPIADYQRELLQLAYDAVSAMPLDPHVKNRSRAQERVVVACLELGQPQRALEFVEGISNWRRGVGYADVALYLIKEGRRDAVESLLQKAIGASELVVRDANPQAWRHDRIRAKVARAYDLLGQPEKAAELAAGIEDSQALGLAGSRGEKLEPGQFDAEMKRLDQELQTGGLERAKLALQTCVSLYDRFYADSARRRAASQRVADGFRTLPAPLRIDLTLQLARAAAAHEDRSEAQNQLGAAKKLLGKGRWLPKDEIALLTRVVATSIEVGELQAAVEDLVLADEIFRTKLGGIVNIDRATALRSIAEGYARLGDPDSAREFYVRAIEAGVENPNSRPRADDLAATCCSMARHQVEPDAPTWGRLRTIRDQLGKNPW